MINRGCVRGFFMKKNFFNGFLFFMTVILFVFTVSCSGRRSTPKGTVMLFIKYAGEKNTDKIYEMLTPESKKKYMKTNDKLLRSDFQVNRYNVKAVRFRNKDLKNNLYYMEIELKDGTSGFITLKKIDGKFYIKLD